MCCSKRFAIRATEENRELIRYLFYGLDADAHHDAKDLLFTFTINRSGHVGNRHVSTLKNLHRQDDDKCKTNEVHLLDVSKI